MTQAERNNIDNALLAANQQQVLRQFTQDAVNYYILYELTPIKKIPATDVVAFGNIYSVTITP